ncbi:MAG TPA: acetate--CoA ligase family protein [Actinomycetota bacterium]|nr:acetate--CoA ligase family protein [Actinomycetota bacterium]
MTGLRVFTDPASVAVVGASANPAKWGYWLARGALRGAGRRRVDLVNAGSAVIEGVPSVSSLTDLPEVPELVVLCTPAAQVPAVVEQALGMGVRGFLGITAGLDAALAEPGAERRLADRIRAAGARLVGPNCLGLYDAAHELELAWGTFTPGHLAVISQSGQLGLEIAGLAAHAGLGISRFVSVGNQVDVTAVDLLADLVDDAATRAVVLYLESFADGRGLVQAMARLRQAGKPVVVLTVGASEASQAAARSHTGSLTSAIDVVAAACRAAGAVLCETPAQAVDLAHLLLGSPLPRGRRVAVVSDSGGQGALATDVLSGAGLNVPRLGDHTAGRLRELLPPAAAVANPIDLAGAGEQDLSTYARVVDVLLDSGEVDAVLLSGYFGSYGLDTPSLQDRELEVVETLAASVARYERPVVVHSMSHDSVAVRSLRAQLVPALHTIDAAARALAQAALLWDLREAAPTGPGASAPPEPGPALDYLAGQELLAAAGVRFPAARAVLVPEDVAGALAGLRAPYALKAAWLEHKTEHGGVVLGLPDEQAVADALADMRTRLGDGRYVIEEMDPQTDVVELIVGTRHDRSFGPLVLVGAGGVTAELHRDTVLALAPVTEQEAARMLRSLKSAALFDGWRGRPPVDLAAAAAAVAAISRLLVEHPEVAEAEINPLRAGPDAAVAVDALVLRAAQAQQHTEQSPLIGVTR